MYIKHKNEQKRRARHATSILSAFN